MRARRFYRKLSQKVHVDQNGGPTPRRRSAAHAPSTRRPSHLPLPRASTRHTIPHASPPANRTSHSTALPPALSTSHSITHNPCTHTPTTCLRAETSGLPVRINKTHARTSRRTDKTTSRTSSSSTTSTTTWRHCPFRASSARYASPTGRRGAGADNPNHLEADPHPSRPAAPAETRTNATEPRA